MLVGSFHRGNRGAQLRVLFSGLRFRFVKRRQRFNVFQIVYCSEVLIKIGEKYHRQFQPAAVHFELRILHGALLLLQLQLCLDGIGVRDFSAAFKFASNIEKTLRLAGRALRRGVLALRHHRSVISLHHCDH